MCRECILSFVDIQLANYILIKFFIVKYVASFSCFIEPQQHVGREGTSFLLTEGDCILIGPLQAN